MTRCVIHVLMLVLTVTRAFTYSHISKLHGNIPAFTHSCIYTPTHARIHAWVHRYVNAHIPTFPFYAGMHSRKHAQKHAYMHIPTSILLDEAPKCLTIPRTIPNRLLNPDPYPFRVLESTHSTRTFLHIHTHSSHVDMAHYCLPSTRYPKHSRIPSNSTFSIPNLLPTFHAVSRRETSSARSPAHSDRLAGSQDWLAHQLSGSPIGSPRRSAWRLY